MLGSYGFTVYVSVATVGHPSAIAKHEISVKNANIESLLQSAESQTQQLDDTPSERLAPSWGEAEGAGKRRTGHTRARGVCVQIPRRGHSSPLILTC